MYVVRVFVSESMQTPGVLCNYACAPFANVWFTLGAGTKDTQNSVGPSSTHDWIYKFGFNIILPVYLAIFFGGVSIAL